MIIGSILISRDLRASSTFKLITNLAFADLSINIVVDSFSIVGVFGGKQFFDKHTLLCHLVGSCCIISCVTALISMFTIALNRWEAFNIKMCLTKWNVFLFFFISRFILIFYPLTYERIFTHKLTIIYCVIAWLIGVSIYLLNIVGPGGIVFGASYSFVSSRF